MFLTKLRTALVVLLVLGVVALAGWGLSRSTATADQPMADASKKEAAIADSGKEEKGRFEIEAQGGRVLIRAVLGGEKLSAVADRLNYDEGKKLLILESKEANGVQVQRQRGKQAEEILCQKMIYSLEDNSVKVLGAGSLKFQEANLAENDLGLTLEPVAWDADTLKSLGLTDLPTVRGGLKVTRVSKGGPAARSGIRPGDVLLGLNGFETVSIENLRFVLTSASHSDSSHLKYVLLRSAKVFSGSLEIERPW